MESKDSNLPPFQIAKNKLNQYLENNRLRKTSERYLLLEMIYNHDTHFYVDELYNYVKSQSYNISKATVYNSLDLFVNCGVVTKHFLNNSTSIYEKTIGQKQHDHFMCQSCGRVIEFCDPRLYQIKKSIEEALDVTIDSHNLYLYGTCSNPKCKSAQS